MEYQAFDPKGITSILVPENEMEKSILNDPEIIEGLTWGYPRFGHPEGKVVYHIQEIFSNIDKIATEPDFRRKLRTLALVHDTFKYKEDRKLVRTDPSKHHARIAHEYIKQYTKEKDVLQVMKTHDDAYYAWRADYAYRDPESAQVMLERLLTDNADHIDLYYTFFVCDTRTGDKNQSPIRWFEKKTGLVNKIKL